MRRLITGALAGLLLFGSTAVAVADRGHGGAREFDIQAHRGGLGYRAESTLSSFGNGLRLGVSTLELDIQITRDGQAVVTHDRQVAGSKCLDTAPVTPGDPQFPYVGKYVKD